MQRARRARRGAPEIWAGDVGVGYISSSDSDYEPSASARGWSARRTPAAHARPQARDGRRAATRARPRVGSPGGRGGDSGGSGGGGGTVIDVHLAGSVTHTVQRASDDGAGAVGDGGGDTGDGGNGAGNRPSATGASVEAAGGDADAGDVLQRLAALARLTSSFAGEEATSDGGSS